MKQIKMEESKGNLLMIFFSFMDKIYVAHSLLDLWLF